MLGRFLTIDGVVEFVRSADIRFASTVALVVWVVFLAWFLTESYLATAGEIPADLKAFGEAFVQAFGRPLIDARPGAPPIRARLRAASRGRELEVLIAPSDGRTYPNLADHKNNLEYDVHRVLCAIGDRHFVSGQLRAEGPWVVIPIRRKADLKEAGVT